MRKMPKCKWIVINDVVLVRIPVKDLRAVYPQIWRLRLKGRTWVLRTVKWSLCDHRVPGHISQPVYFFLTTFIEIRVDIRNFMQLHTHIAFQFYLTALLPEGTTGQGSDGLLSWCTVKEQWALCWLVHRSSLGRMVQLTQKRKKEQYRKVSQDSI